MESIIVPSTISSGNVDTLKTLTDKPMDLIADQLEALKTKRFPGKDIDKPSPQNFKTGRHLNSYVQILAMYFWVVVSFFLLNPH